MFQDCNNNGSFTCSFLAPHFIEPLHFMGLNFSETFNLRSFPSNCSLQSKRIMMSVNLGNLPPALGLLYSRQFCTWLWVLFLSHPGETVHWMWVATVWWIVCNLWCGFCSQSLIPHNSSARTIFLPSLSSKDNSVGQRCTLPVSSVRKFSSVYRLRPERERVRYETEDKQTSILKKVFITQWKTDEEFSFILIMINLRSVWDITFIGHFAV